ncbi:hypothetical protein AcV5_007779 [Taiwanofungus camphoratus]|nr:hypothetical protein AcV5_007779 [Antrodia cinnamomea]
MESSIPSSRLITLLWSGDNESQDVGGKFLAESSLLRKFLLKIQFALPLSCFDVGRTIKWQGVWLLLHLDSLLSLTFAVATGIQRPESTQVTGCYNEAPTFMDSRLRRHTVDGCTLLGNSYNSCGEFMASVESIDLVIEQLWISQMICEESSTITT